MKISNETAQKLLAELGVDVEVVAENEDKDVDINSLVEDVTNTLKPTIETGLKETLETAIGARQNGTALSAIQQVFGIPKKDLDGKTFKEMFGIVKEHVSKGGADEANEWKTKYETAVQDYEAQLENKETEWQTKYDADISVERQKYSDRDINDGFVALVNKLPRQGGDPLKQAKVLRNLAKEEGIEVSYDEGKKELVFKKDGKLLKADDTISNLAKDVLPVATSTNHIKPKDVLGNPIVQRQEGAPLDGIPAGDKMAEFYSKLG
jgi:hypothetical protein